MIRRVNITAIFFLVLFAFALTSSATAASSKEASRVTSDGNALWNEDETTTKKAALDSALRGAVRAALVEFATEMVVSDNESYLEAEVYGNVLRYVLNYRILSQGYLTHYDMPELEAKLKAMLMAAGIEDESELSVGVQGPQGPAGPGSEGEEGGTGFEGVMAARAIAPGGGVNVYHMKIEATVDILQLKKDVRSILGELETEIHPVEVLVLGVEGYSGFDNVRRKIMDTEVVSDLIYLSFSGERFRVKIKVSSSVEEFIDKVKSGLGSKYAVFRGSADKRTGTESVVIKALLRGRR